MVVGGENEEPLSFEQAKGRFFQGESGDRLLSLINNEILKSGGRTRMGYHITHIEASEWFKDSEIKKHYRWQMGSLLNVLNKNATNGKSKRSWNDEQVEYLKNWWSKLDYNIIAKNLNKSKDAIRAKAKEIMTPEEFESRFYNRTKAGIVYNEKFGHHARQQQRKHDKERIQS